MDERQTDMVRRTRDYVRDAFEAHPHHSFDDWMIMYRHSVKVHDYAMQLTAEMPELGADELVVAVGALLHDIGKTFEADEETVHRLHGEKGYEVAKDFLESLGLDDTQLSKLEEILTESGESTELKIINDADVLAFYADRRLQDAFDDWATVRKTPEKKQDKLTKYAMLNFKASKEIARPMYEDLKRRWV